MPFHVFSFRDILLRKYTPLCFESLRNQRLCTTEQWKFLSFFITRIFRVAPLVPYEKESVCFVHMRNKGTVASLVTDKTSLWSAAALKSKTSSFYPPHCLVFSRIRSFLSHLISSYVSLMQHRPAVWLVSANQLDLRLTQTLSDWPSEHIVGSTAGCPITLTIAVVLFSRQNWPGLFVMAELRLSARVAQMISPQSWLLLNLDQILDQIPSDKVHQYWLT